MNAGEKSALMSADLITAGPNAAGTFAVTREDERLRVVRLHEPHLIDAVLRGRAFGFVHVLLALVVVGRRVRLIEGGDGGRGVLRADRRSGRERECGRTKCER